MGLCDGCPPWTGGGPCGITDTFNRADSDVAGGLGISDSTLEWFNGAKQGPGWSDAGLGPSHLIYNVGGRGRAIGWYDGDNPGNTWIDYPRAVIERPTTLPDSDFWPFPFQGSIVLTDADSFPGFSGPDFMAGYPFSPAGGGRNDGGEFRLSASGGAINLSGGGAGNSPRWFSPYEPLEITGRFRITESGLADPGNESAILDDYINIGLGGGGPWGSKTAQVTHGTPGSGHTWLSFSDLGFDDQPFPDFFWTALDGASVDFSLDYTGGFGGTLTVTIGPCTLSRTLDPDQLVTGAGFGGGGVYGGSYPAEPSYDMYVDDTFRVNDKMPQSAISWQWVTFGGTAAPDNKTLRYTFAYYTYGADAGFPHGPPTGYETGDVDYGDPDGLHPAVVGPLMMIRIEEVSTSSTPGASIFGSVVAWLQLDDEVLFPFIPYVTITATGATLTIALNILSVSNADAVDFTTGDADPLGDTIMVQGHLMMDLVNGLGTYIGFDDLDIEGVNNCTVTSVTPGPSAGPLRFQSVQDEAVGTGDGTTTAFETNWPYLGGSLQVTVAGMLTEADNTDPPAGTFTFLDPPPAGAFVRASYRAAGA